MCGNDPILCGKLERSQVRLVLIRLFVSEVVRNDAILGGKWVLEQMRGRGDALIYGGGRVESM